ncbi:polysaccharide biosynthesis tyrosine autokinase [Brachybacterium paraconglomeratum]|uniref:polysaccharide biosynthesis tyrosine autokinase n=1 Tax=Brachybacterium paraconglomeratum TaxID=173362 RepID=UPI0031EC395B
MNLRFLIASARKFWWLAVLMAIIGAAGMFGYSSTQTPLFKATTSLHFALDRGASATDLNQGSAYTQSQMLSFAQLVQGSSVLEPVIDELDLETTPKGLAKSLQVSIPQDTVTMRITATTTDPRGSAALATSVGEHLIEEVQGVAPKNPDGTSTITAVIYDDAVAPAFQTSPDKKKDALLGGLVGGIAGAAAALVVALLDTRVRSEETLAEASRHPVLGVVTKSPLLSGRTIAMAQQPLSHTAEEFLRIRSALTYASVNSRVKVLLVTACLPGEGKSTVSVNLAMALAGKQDSVLLIDADLRRPRAHEYAGIDGSVGLTNVLLHEVDVDIAKHRIRGTGLDILPAGKIPPNPAEMLTSQRMADLVASMTDEYSYIVIDTPPVLSVADANLLAPIVDGVILAVDASKTRRANLTRTMKTLESGGARILGTVLNRARGDSHREKYYSEDLVD